MAETQCVFCEILSGELPSSLVYDGERIVAFMEINPVTPGHALVVPRRHLPYLADLTSELAGEMMIIAQRLAAALRRSSLRTEGVNLFYADGEAAFQEVFHAHLHVIPRFSDDGFVIGARWGTNPSRAELDRQAAEIRSVVERD